MTSFYTQGKQAALTKLGLGRMMRSFITGRPIASINPLNHFVDDAVIGARAVKNKVTNAVTSAVTKAQTHFPKATAQVTNPESLLWKALT